MSETWCGKDCRQCLRHPGTCPGCKVRHAAYDFEGCPIESCCSEKTRVCCTDCALRARCAAYALRETAPEGRRKLPPGAATLSGRLSLLFWIPIAAFAAAVLAVVSWLLEPSVSVHTFSSFAGAACSLACLSVMFTLRKADDKYGGAAVFRLIAAVASVLNIGYGALPLGLEFISYYLEQSAHASVLDQAGQEVAARLAKRWRGMCKLCTVIIIMLFLVLLTNWFSETLSKLLLIAAFIALLALEVLRLVFILRTARFFRGKE